MSRAVENTDPDHPVAVLIARSFLVMSNWLAVLIISYLVVVLELFAVHLLNSRNAASMSAKAVSQRCETGENLDGFVSTRRRMALT